MSSTLTSQQVRQLRDQFWQSKHHLLAKPVSLVASSENKSVLFNVAGMQQFVPYLIGKSHPLGKRLYNIQPCIRTNDIEDIGDERHLSMFEMMGNWSLGDYFKHDALTRSVEFLVNVLGIDKSRLGATIFAGDDALWIPRDIESYEILQSLWINHITEIWFDKNGDSDNFWTPGAVGPCGPSCELFYDRGEEGQDYSDPLTGDTMTSDRNLWVNDRYTEIWNNVFMAYYQDGTGDGFTPLAQTNVDTGMGFERLMMVLQNTDTIYESDLFLPIIQQIELITKTQYKNNNKSYRVIVDHLRASVFLIADWVTPSNEWRWYILRRLIRRAYYYVTQLIQTNHTAAIQIIIDTIITHYESVYPYIHTEMQAIISECIKFQRTLDQGKTMLMELIAKSDWSIDGEIIFKLYDTYGFPVELTTEILDNHQISYEILEYESAMDKAKSTSRAHTNFKNTIDRSKYLRGIAETKFVWYDQLSIDKWNVLADLDIDGMRVIVLDQTVFYPEMWWQRGDTGQMMLPSGEQVSVTNTIKFAGVILHIVE